MQDTHQPNRDALLRRLRRERLHVQRGALEKAPAAAQRRFAHAWAPAEALLALLQPWPAGLIAFWLDAPAGHVVLSADSYDYLPGPFPWLDTVLPSVARVNLADLLDGGAPALYVIAGLIDHLLGSRGLGKRLSDGVGATPRLQQAAERLASLAHLGYGPPDPHAYFAWAFSRYWLDRRALNADDPNVERLLGTTVCSERFWT
jgi:hypothetical protein